MGTFLQRFFHDPPSKQSKGLNYFVLVTAMTACLLALLFATVAFSQPTFVWAKNLGGSGNDVGYGVAMDRNGNTYVTGSFVVAGDFDPGAGTVTLTPVGGLDIFLAKYDANGDYVWAKSIGSAADDEGWGITVDTNSNVYITGYFSGTADFDPGAATADLVTTGLNDVFFAKYDANGNYVWAKNFGAATDNDFGRDIAVDASGNVYITGWFTGNPNPVDFDPGAGTANLTSRGWSDIYFAKYDANGNYVWAKSVGTMQIDYGSSIAVDGSGNVYVSGFFTNGPADFDPGAGVANLTSVNAQDGFFAKYDSNGNYIWAKNIGTNNNDWTRAIAVDGSSNVYICGYFNNGTADFDPGAGVANLTSAGGEDIFFAKYDSNGNYIWAKNVGGTSNDEGRDIAVDGSGNVYITGDFTGSGTVDFDPGAGIANLTSPGGTEIFIAKYDTDGNYVCAGRLGGTGGDRGWSIAVDGSGNLYTSGYFQGGGNADFDPGAGVYPIPSVNASWDVFLAKYSGCSITFSASATGDTVCRGICATVSAAPGGGTTPFTYSWSPGGSTGQSVSVCPTITSVYTVTITDAGANTATATATVIVNPKPTADAGSNVTICPGSSTQLSGSGGGAYQWAPAATLDNAAIANPVATPTATTTYRLMVTGAGGCSDSDSVVVTIGSNLALSITNDTAVCAGGSMQLSAGGGSTYSWAPAATLSNGAIPNPVATPTATTTYVVTVQDTAGCQGTDSVTVTVNQPPNADAGGDTAICTDASVQLNASGGISYTWSPAGSLDNAGVSNPVASPTTATTYYVTVTDGNGCPATDSVRVSISPSPVVNFNDTASGCGSVTVTFNNFSNGGATYFWDFGDGSTSPAFGPAHTYGTPGSYSVKLVVTTASGCSDSLVFVNMINVYPQPVADFSASPQQTSPGAPVQFTDLSSGGTPCLWDFGDGSTSTAANPTHTYNDTGCFTVLLRVCTVNGCTDTATGLICVAQDKTLDIPNTITPNGDGANDKWIITNIDQYPGHMIEIYNRNGNLLRTLTDYQNDWDGTADGKELPSAPYYFVLDLGDGSEEMKGVLTIIR